MLVLKKNLSFFFLWIFIISAFPSQPDIQSPVPKFNLNKNIYVGVYGGINYSLPHVLSSYSVLNQSGISQPGEKIYGAIGKNRGYQLGAIGIMNLNEHIAIGVLPATGFYFIRYGSSNAFTSANTLITGNYSFTIRYWTVELPIQGYYIFNPEKKLNLYGTLGAKYGFIASSYKASVYSETMTVDGEVEGIYSNSFKSWSKRMLVRSNIQFSAGAGIMYQMGKYRIFVEGAYLKGIRNLTNVSYRYNDTRNLYTDPDIQDDFLADNLVINLGILYKIGNARKKIKCVTPEEIKR